MSDDVIRRTFAAELVPSGDGRTLDVRIIPYHTVARVSDGGPAYDEEWLPGVFEKQIKAANRVFVNVEHEKGFRGVVGKGQEFRETPTGFEGSMRVDEGPDGDKALRYVGEGILTGISLEATPLVSQRSAQGVVQRVKARLNAIALCRTPAFEDAQVLAVREAPDDPSLPEDEPAPDDPAPEPEPELPSEPEMSRTAETLQRLGFQPLTSRVVSQHPWDASRERFTDEQYAAACLVEGALPVLEPNGDINREAVLDAARRLNLVGLESDQKAAAARKLVRYFRVMDERPPEALIKTAYR